MPLISNSFNMWKMFAMQINEFVLEVFSVTETIHILVPAISTNGKRTWFMKEKQRKYVFHNRQKVKLPQCPAQSKAFTYFSMQSTLSCECKLTSYEKGKHSVQLYTPVREAIQVTAMSRKSLLWVHTNFLHKLMHAIACSNKIHKWTSKTNVAVQECLFI